METIRLRMAKDREARMHAHRASIARPARSVGGGGTRKRDAVFRAVADPTRREILSLLRDSQQSVGQIAGNFRMSRPAVSKHLRLLRLAGLVTTRQEGTSRFCSLNAQPLRAINEWLRDYELFWSESLQGLKSYMEERP
jgi:DNA-binding transcriptional ArsR family regulator